MNNLVSWEYYNSFFPKLSEDRFNQLIYRAERMVMKRLNTDQLTEEQEKEVMDCVCNVVNQLDVYERSSGLASISNDGYSKSFATSTSDEQKQSIDSIIEEWLGDTGLLKQKFLVF